MRGSRLEARGDWCSCVFTMPQQEMSMKDFVPRWGGASRHVCCQDGEGGHRPHRWPWLVWSVALAWLVAEAVLFAEAIDFALGGTAGAISKTITAPIERVPAVAAIGVGTVAAWSRFCVFVCFWLGDGTREVKLVIQTQDANPKIISGEVLSMLRGAALIW